MDELSMFNEKLKVNVGVRYSFAKSHFNQYGDKSKSKDNIVTPRVGINYMILPSFYVYGLYDNTFIPIAGVNSDGGGLKHLKGTSYEAGIKKEWFNKALTTYASYYHIRRKNNVITDPVTNQIYQMG